MSENYEITNVDTSVPANPMMPFVPEILINAMPAPMPQMQFNHGIVRNFFHNVKVNQMVKATEAEAMIAGNKQQYVASSLQMVEDITTFSARLQLRFKQIKHEEEMMKIAKDTADAQLVEQQLKNMLLKNEVELSEIEKKIKLKEMEDIFGGFTQTESRQG